MAKFRSHIFYRSWDIRYEILKTKYFQAFFLMYLQAHEHRDFCAIFESRFRAPNHVKTGNRGYVCSIFIAIQDGEEIFEISS